MAGLLCFAICIVVPIVVGVNADVSGPAVEGQQPAGHDPRSHEVITLLPESLDSTGPEDADAQVSQRAGGPADAAVSSSGPAARRRRRAQQAGVAPKCRVPCAADAASCPGSADIDGDGIVSVDDLLLLLSAFGSSSAPAEDIDGSGEVSVSDLLSLLAAFGNACAVASPSALGGPPPPCEDAEDWRDAHYGGSCSEVAAWGECHRDADDHAVTASTACPISCGTGCALAFDDCWNNPCANGGVCVDLLSDYTCICPIGFCTEGCATPDSLDLDPTLPRCPPPPCEDDDSWRDAVYGISCPDLIPFPEMCSQLYQVNARGLIPRRARLLC